MHKILCIEDCEESKQLVTGALGSMGVNLKWARNLNQAAQFIEDEQFDLILLDVMLPDGDGFKFLPVISNAGHAKNTPVIFLTSKDSLSDKVLGLSLGADDYIVKPFEPLELKARVETRLKKYETLKKQMQILTKGELELNLASQRAFDCSSGEKKDLALTPLEFKILVTLASNEEFVFSREQLLDRIWGNTTYLTDRCVDTHIYSLRKKLGNLSNCIQAIYGEGYRFSPKRNN
ncbi:MAG: response regulator transcription factor [Oligoflexia bacterium]|nr:response regulator transcription factor [Oligoflexia bacterium]